MNRNSERINPFVRAAITTVGAVGFAWLGDTQTTTLAASLITNDETSFMGVGLQTVNQVIAPATTVAFLVGGGLLFYKLTPWILRNIYPNSRSSRSRR